MTAGKNKCPNCLVQLDTFPRRKAKCPHCNQFIFVRKGKLLSEDEAQTEDWLVYLEQFGITKQKFETSRRELSERFRSKASVHDTVWGILNHQVSITNNLELVKNAYYEMARLANWEGKDEKPFIENALRIELISYKKRGIKFVIVTNYGGQPDYSTCSECANLHGKRFQIEDALERMPIPRNCVHDTGCRCSYEPSD